MSADLNENPTLEYAAALEKLSLRQGDILLIHGFPDKDLLKSLLLAGDIAGVDAQVPIVVLGNVTLEAVDGEAMNKAGWFRKDEGV